MEIVRYNPSLKNEWNDFVAHSKNATFLLHRDFMEYHADRFTDYSLLIYESSKLVALLPANLTPDRVVHSHQGLTYGSLILADTAKAEQVKVIFESLIEYLKAQSIAQFIYKAIPHIYHIYPSEEDLYALYLNRARLFSRTIASVIDLRQQPLLSYSQLRKRQIKKARLNNLSLTETNDLAPFWDILNKNLFDRHQTSPVHSLAEIQHLKKLFPRNIRLFCVSKDEEVISGCLVFETSKVVHVQYISANEAGRELGALDYLFDWLINNIFRHKDYFDFGISTENNGLFLNEGLISQKEGFGARGIVYDTYCIDLKEQTNGDTVS